MRLVYLRTLEPRWVGLKRAAAAAASGLPYLFQFMAFSLISGNWESETMISVLMGILVCRVFLMIISFYGYHFVPTFNPTY